MGCDRPYGSAIILRPGQQRIETGADCFRVELEGRQVEVICGT